MEKNRLQVFVPQPTINYNLDGVQNRTSVTNGPDAGTYTLSPTTPEPNDITVNQYTSIPHGGGTNNAFDANGNLTLKGADAYEYDYRNQLIEQTRATQTDTYAYDCLGRRIRKAVDATGTNVKTDFIYEGWRVLEERQLAGAYDPTSANLTAQYVYGRFIDEPVMMRRDITIWHARIAIFSPSTASTSTRRNTAAGCATSARARAAPTTTGPHSLMRHGKRLFSRKRT